VQLTSLADLDDELDLINVQNNLRDSLLSITPTTRSTQSSLEAYVSINLSNLKRRPAFHQLFVTLAQQLVNGSALDIEGLVDVLTLKDIQAMEGGDAVVALDRLFKDTVSGRVMVKCMLALTAAGAAGRAEAGCAAVDLAKSVCPGRVSFSIYL
jgi:hypothetical protein